MASVEGWPRECGLCGVAALTPRAFLGHITEHLARCEALWDDGRTYHLAWPPDSFRWRVERWHRCILPTVHDEPHQCGCGETFTPAPLEV